MLWIYYLTKAYLVILHTRCQVVMVGSLIPFQPSSWGVQLVDEDESWILCLVLHHCLASPHPCTSKITWCWLIDQSLIQVTSEYCQMKAKLVSIAFKNPPVSLIRGRNIWRKTPLAHLQNSNEKQWVNSKYAWRNFNTHDLCCALGGVAEVVCVWKCTYMVVESYRALNCEIREDPISWSKWTCIPQ